MSKHRNSKVRSINITVGVGTFPWEVLSVQHVVDEEEATQMHGSRNDNRYGSNTPSSKLRQNSRFLGRVSKLQGTSNIPKDLQDFEKH